MSRSALRPNCISRSPHEAEEKLFVFTILGPAGLSIGVAAKDFTEARRQLRLMPDAGPVVKLLDDGVEPKTLDASRRVAETGQKMVVRTWLHSQIT